MLKMGQREAQREETEGPLGADSNPWTTEYMDLSPTASRNGSGIVMGLEEDPKFREGMRLTSI